MTKAKHTRTWSPQYDAILREGVAIKLSYAKIAELLPGVTRDAAAARGKRLNLHAWKPAAEGPIKNRSVSAFAHIVDRRLEKVADPEPEPQDEPAPPRCGLRIFSFERTDAVSADRVASVRGSSWQFALGREQRARRAVG